MNLMYFILSMLLISVILKALLVLNVDLFLTTTGGRMRTIKFGAPRRKVPASLVSHN